MLDAAPVGDKEFSKVLNALLYEFYAARFEARLAIRLVQGHSRAWLALLSNQTGLPEMAAFGRDARAAALSTQELREANDAVAWALTPAVTASLACGPGDEPVSLRDVHRALRDIGGLIVVEEAQDRTAAAQDLAHAA